MKLTSPKTNSATAPLYRPPAFATLKDQELVAVYSAPTRKYACGEIIVDENDRSGSFVILTGAARMTPGANDTRTLAALGRGEWFGTLGTEEALPYAVSAAEPSTVMNLNSAVVERLPQKAQNAIHQGLLDSILKAFRAINEQTGQDTQRLDGLVGLQSRLATKTAASTRAFIKPYLANFPSLPPYATDLGA